MNGKQSKRIRKIVYGEETYRQRSYTWDQKLSDTKIYGKYQWVDDHIIADIKRRAYQKLKKLQKVRCTIPQLREAAKILLI